jgi:hypothetical protein
MRLPFQPLPVFLRMPHHLFRVRLQHFLLLSGHVVPAANATLGAWIDCFTHRPSSFSVPSHLLIDNCTSLCIIYTCAPFSAFTERSRAEARGRCESLARWCWPAVAANAKSLAHRTCSSARADGLPTTPSSGYAGTRSATSQSPHVGCCGLAECVSTPSCSTDVPG